jgi:hypothetical protein
MAHQPSKQGKTAEHREPICPQGTSVRGAATTRISGCASTAVFAHETWTIRLIKGQNTPFLSLHRPFSAFKGRKRSVLPLLWCLRPAAQRPEMYVLINGGEPLIAFMPPMRLCSLVFRSKTTPHGAGLASPWRRCEVLLVQVWFLGGDLRHWSAQIPVLRRRSQPFFHTCARN